MSTKKIREALKALAQYAEWAHNGPDEKVAAEALEEVDAIERAAKALAEVHVADMMVDRVAHSDAVVSDMIDGRSETQWFHPKVTAVAEACALVEAIAKETS